MDSSEFNFKEITEDSITYYIIPEGTILYHGSNNISSPEQLQEKRHTFFALTNEYASKYAKESGNVFKFRVNKEIHLVALDKPNETLYKNAPLKIQKIMNENYGFHNDHKRKSIPDKDNTLSMYLCEVGYNGYAANNMSGVSNVGDDDLDPEVIICDKQNLKFIEIIQNKASVGPPRVERHKKTKHTVFETPQKKGPGLFETPEKRGPGLFETPEKRGPGLFRFDTPIKGGNKKQNLSNVYKKKTMKRPVRAEDGTYTVKGKK